MKEERKEQGSKEARKEKQQQPPYTAGRKGLPHNVKHAQRILSNIPLNS